MLLVKTLEIQATQTNYYKEISMSEVHSETDITAGDLQVNDAYDLHLNKLPNGDYDLVVL